MESTEIEEEYSDDDDDEAGLSDDADKEIRLDMGMAPWRAFPILGLPLLILCLVDLDGHTENATVHCNVLRSTTISSNTSSGKDGGDVIRDGADRRRFIRFIMVLLESRPTKGERQILPSESEKGKILQFSSGFTIPR